MMGVSVTFRIFAIVDYALLLAAISENVQTQFLTLLFAFLSLIATAWIAKRQANSDKATGEVKLVAEKAVELSAKSKEATDEVKQGVERITELTEAQTVVIEETRHAVNSKSDKQDLTMEELRKEVFRLNELVLSTSVGEAAAKQEVKSGKEASEKAVAVAAEAAGRSGIGIAPPPHAAIHPAAPADEVQKVEIVKIPDHLEKPKR